MFIKRLKWSFTTGCTPLRFGSSTASSFRWPLDRWITWKWNYELIQRPIVILVHLKTEGSSLFNCQTFDQCVTCRVLPATVGSGASAQRNAHRVLGFRRTAHSSGLAADPAARRPNRIRVRAAEPTFGRSTKRSPVQESDRTKGQWTPTFLLLQRLDPAQRESLWCRVSGIWLNWKNYSRKSFKFDYLQTEFGVVKHWPWSGF